MKNIFESYFKSSLLNEDDSLSDELSNGLDEQPSEDADTQALADDMSSDIDTQDDEMAQAEQANAAFQSKIEGKIKEDNDKIAEWAKALEEFANFVNDPTNEESMKHIIDNAGTGSAMASIKKTASAQMTKVATDCAVLSQTLRSLIGSVTAEDVLGGEK